MREIIVGMTISLSQIWHKQNMEWRSHFEHTHTNDEPFLVERTKSEHRWNFVRTNRLNWNNDDNIINILLTWILHLVGFFSFPLCSANTYFNVKWLSMRKWNAMLSFLRAISILSIFYYCCFFRIRNLIYGKFSWLNENQWRILMKSVTKIVELLITTETERSIWMSWEYIHIYTCNHRLPSNELQMYTHIETVFLLNIVWPYARKKKID